MAAKPATAKANIKPIRYSICHHTLALSVRDSGLLGLSRPASAGAAANMIECDGASSQKNQSESDRCQREREVIAAWPEETILEVHAPDGHRHLEENGQRGQDT